MPGSKAPKKKLFKPLQVSLGESGGLIWQGSAGHAHSQSLPHATHDPMSPSGT
ncbi:hypothetical protein FRC11_013327, partial [Ceratobasidium sp. 423]